MATDRMVKYRILGPLEVTGGDLQECHIPRGRQQVVLGALLLEANRVVSTEDLIAAVWGEDPPATARTQIQTCISALRYTLATTGQDAPIVTREPGYIIQVADGQLDSQIFSKRISEAYSLIRESRTDRARAVLREANGLWRGHALSGTMSDKLRSKVSQMEENRLSALETYADLELQAGRHHQIVGELRALVAEHPLRERMRGQLMLALYRAGRQAEALETYRVGRLLLVQEFGLEPSDELKRLELAVLSGDAALQPPAPVSPPKVASTAAPEARPKRPGNVVSSQLPPDTQAFIGRTGLIAQIEGLLTGTGEPAGRIAVLTGPAGVGKTTLAVHLAHRLADHFPDGRLYCDLGGAGQRPLPPAEVLGRFLRVLGVPGDSLPDSVDQRAGMFRQLMAGRRALVVLDDAAGEHQLRSLLPGGDSAVLITGGPRVVGLTGARVFTLDVFENADVLRMLAAAIGEHRVFHEPQAAETLGRLVGRLPLALRIVAARLAARPHWSLAWMVDRLSDEHRILDELVHGDLAIRTRLAMTYSGLGEDARKMLRLLSLLEGPSTSAWAAGALLDTDVFHAGDLVENLVDAQMLEVAGTNQAGSPRYKLHGLIRLFAREELEKREAPETRRAALARVLGGWLTGVDEAHRRIYGGDFTVLHGTAARRPLPAGYLDRALANPLGWLESERDNLCSAVTVAAVAGQAEACWELAVGLVSLFEARCSYDDWERTHLRALESVRAAGLRRGYAALMCSLGSLDLSRSQPAAAETRLLPAFEAFDEIGDVHGRALTRRNLALLEQQRGSTEPAAAHFGHALADFRTAGDRVGAASVLVHMAHAECERGNLDAAHDALAEALAICQDAGSQRVEVQARYVLSDVLQRQARYQDAREILTEALQQVRERHDLAGESRILHRLGLVSARLGRGEAARQLLREAIAAHERITNRVAAAEARLELAQLELALEDQERASGIAGNPEHHGSPRYVY